ncbi:excalibur calcium-binding domain-containing protein [Sagittula sp. M10.9X]|uniref:Excalibur calcium-binding domain-containing protein n=1 Tax=Sagittula salina TaxID=2820268 RepID=A0A940S3L2_9RHOB|nr:excalibur calcium-binding domain-containing protein [Sagittula salina]
MRLVFLLYLFLATASAQADPLTVPDLRERMEGWHTVQAFDCRDVSCRRLRSCEEACFKLIQCGQSKRDGDHDGIPCENLCRSRC